MSTTTLGQFVSERARQLVQLPSTSSSLVDEVVSISDQIQQATTKAMDLHQCDHYTRRPGLAALCKRVAEQLGAQGIKVDPTDGVLITGSIQEARFVTLRSLAAGKTVYAPQPAAEAYRAGIDFANANLQVFDPDGDLPTAPGDLLIMPYRHPTTGQVLDEAAVQRLSAWALDNDMTLLLDKTLEPGAVIQALAILPDLASRTIILGSFAALGRGAWQVSWVAGHSPLVTTVRDMKQAMTICTPAASQYAALASLESHSSHVRD